MPQIDRENHLSENDASVSDNGNGNDHCHGNNSGKIIAFRLKNPALDKLNARFTEQPILGINSVEQFIRKLVVDYTNGKLVYLLPSDAKTNPTLRS